MAEMLLLLDHSKKLKFFQEMEFGPIWYFLMAISALVTFNQRKYKKQNELTHATVYERSPLSLDYSYRKSFVKLKWAAALAVKIICKLWVSGSD